MNEKDQGCMTSGGIQKIAVVGAGLMGHGIALEFAARGFDVRLHDQEPAQLERAWHGIAEGLGRLAEIDRISPQAATSAPSRITAGTNLQAAVAGADLVVEAVSEDLGVKQALYRELDALAPSHAILASNTSSFMPSLLAAATTRPDRVLV